MELCHLAYGFLEELGIQGRGKCRMEPTIGGVSGTY